MGVCTAIELNRHGAKVILVDSGEIPNPLAGSTDISKIVRLEYGSDEEYTEMAMESMADWRLWNQELGEKVYHETGFLLLARASMEDPVQKFERDSFHMVKKKGFSPQRLDEKSIANQFSAFNSAYYQDGFYHEIGGYAESGKAVHLLVQRAMEMGVHVLPNHEMKQLIVEKSQVRGVTFKDQSRLFAGETVLCSGHFTSHLLPELKEMMKVTGHPVFHIRPKDPSNYLPPRFSVFAADISNTGWYGFPMHPTEKVVKIARHSNGRELNPYTDDRTVSAEEYDELKEFLQISLPGLVEHELVYTRCCCYADTLDGHFLIDRHPEMSNLTIGSGGSGHAFKMGPVIGKMIANVALGRSHGWSDRYNWRNLDAETGQAEEARFVRGGKV